MEYKSVVNKLDTELNVDKSYDVIKRNLKFANNEVTLYFVDGLTKDDMLKTGRNLYFPSVFECS